MDERRYVVMGVWRDGVPQDLSRWSSLEDALSERDLQRRDHFTTRGAPHFAVYDSDDPERGYLDHEDVAEEARA